MHISAAVAPLLLTKLIGGKLKAAATSLIGEMTVGPSKLCQSFSRWFCESSNFPASLAALLGFNRERKQNGEFRHNIQTEMDMEYKYLYYRLHYSAILYKHCQKYGSCTLIRSIDKTSGTLLVQQAAHY